MKRLLMLGGAQSQIPAIQYARDAGHYVITCDYLPDNPGHQYGHEYHNVSTTDIDGVLKLAKGLNIDGVVAYASDPAAVTAAYVAEHMGLPGNSIESTKILSEKDRFRDFSVKNGFNTPNFCIIKNSSEICETPLRLPFIVKPVDSSGSKGITIVKDPNSFKEAVWKALARSRSKRVIVEEIIESPYNQIHGDCFFIDGKMVLSCLGDHHFKLGSLAPYSTTLPSRIEENLMQRVEKEISRFINLCGFTHGPVNVEARIGFDDEIYLIDMGARSGGNYVPQLVEMATGFNMVAATINGAFGDYDEIEIRHYPVKNFVSHCVLGSEKKGILNKVDYSPIFYSRIMKEYMYLQTGSPINVFEDSSNTIGVLLLSYKNSDEMESIISHIYEHIFLDIISV